MGESGVDPRKWTTTNISSAFDLSSVGDDFTKRVVSISKTLSREVSSLKRQICVNSELFSSLLKSTTVKVNGVEITMFDELAKSVHVMSRCNTHYRLTPSRFLRKAPVACQQGNECTCSFCEEFWRTHSCCRDCMCEASAETASIHGKTRAISACVAVCVHAHLSRATNFDSHINTLAYAAHLPVCRNISILRGGGIPDVQHVSSMSLDDVKAGDVRVKQLLEKLKSGVASVTRQELEELLKGLYLASAISQIGFGKIGNGTRKPRQSSLNRRKRVAEHVHLLVQANAKVKHGSALKAKLLTCHVTGSSKLSRRSLRVERGEKRGSLKGKRLPTETRRIFDFSAFARTKLKRRKTAMVVDEAKRREGPTESSDSNASKVSKIPKSSPKSSKAPRDEDETEQQGEAFVNCRHVTAAFAMNTIRRRRAPYAKCDDDVLGVVAKIRKRARRAPSRLEILKKKGECADIPRRRQILAMGVNLIHRKHATKESPKKKESLMVPVLPKQNKEAPKQQQQRPRPMHPRLKSLKAARSNAAPSRKQAMNHVAVAESRSSSDDESSSESSSESSDSDCSTEMDIESVVHGNNNNNNNHGGGHMVVKELSAMSNKYITCGFVF